MNYRTSLYPGVPSYVLQEGLGSGARVTQWLPRGHFDLPGEINLGDSLSRAKTIRGGSPLAGIFDVFKTGKAKKARAVTPSQFQANVRAVALRNRTRNPRYAAAIASGLPSVRRAHAAASKSAAKNIYNIAISMPAESRKEFLQETLNNVAPGLYGSVASRASVIEAKGNNANDATIAAMSDALTDFANDGKIVDDETDEYGMNEEEWMGKQQLDGIGDAFKKIGKGVAAAAKAVAGATRKVLCTAGQLASQAPVGAAVSSVACKTQAVAPGEQQVVYEKAGGSAAYGPAGMSTSTKLMIGGAAVGGILLIVMASRGRK